jgi:Ca2+-binding RTX toxin-like protein
MHDRSQVRPRMMIKLVTVVTIIAAIGVAGPYAAGSPTPIKVVPNEIKFGTKVVGTDYFDDVVITNASNQPLQFLVEGGLPDDFGFGLFPGSTCPALTPGAILAPGESCKAVVRFTPTAFFAGSEQTGSLTVTATDLGTGVVTSALVSVSGRGKLPTCSGVAATIVGTQFDERIEGTAGDDVIVGLGGRDIIDGLDGNDLVCGNEGSDVINGGPGNDTMLGGADQDFITGVDGDDLMRGEGGDDVLNFGDEENGDDVVYGGEGDDDLHAGVGADQLFGQDGNDFLAEGEVDAPLIDLFSGGPGVDTCFAGAEDSLKQCEVLS